MDSDRTGIHRPLTNVADVPSVGRAPFARIAALPGTAGALHTKFGVLVSRDTGVALYSDDLAQERWNFPTPSRKELVRWNDRVLLGPVDGEVVDIDISTGSVRQRIPCAMDGWVRAADDRFVIVAGAQQIACFDSSSGALLWQHDWSLPYVASLDGRVYVRRGLSDDLACVNAESGVCDWTFRAVSEGSGGRDDQTHVIFDFAVLPDYIVVVTRDARVHKLDPQTGCEIAVGRPEVSGLPLVTETSVFFKSPDSLSEYNHARLEQVSQLQYGPELRRVWTRPLPAVNAYCVTTESVIWTTMSGVMFGVDRTSNGKDRACWVEDLHGALMPTFQPPFVGGHLLYYEPKRSANGLVCYAAAH